MGRRTIGMPFARLRAPAAVALAGLVAAVAVLGGCQSEETPPATASPSASVTSASPSPSATVPTPSVSATVEIPAAAREKTEKGAEAFVRFFFDQVNEAWTEPAPGLIASLSSPGCDFCTTTEEAAQGLAKADQKYSTNPVTVRGVDVLTGAPTGQVYLFADMLQNRSDIIDASGNVVTTDERKVIPSNVAVRWSGAAWQMHAVEQTP